jgi:hypothetical protein
VITKAGSTKKRFLIRKPGGQEHEDRKREWLLSGAYFVISLS